MLAKTDLPLSHEQVHCLNEMLTRAVYTNIVKRGDQVIDLGANTGDHTRELAKLVGPAGLVHAFEPNREHFLILAGIENTRLWPFAAGEALCIERLYVPQGLDGWASLQDIREEQATRKFDIQTIVQLPVDSIDEINFDRVTFAKIDVERREFQALSGMTEILRRRRAVFVVENVTKEIETLCAAEQYAQIAMHPTIPLMNSILAPVSLPRGSFIPTAKQIDEAMKIMRRLQVS